jgi:hypothetical protein
MTLKERYKSADLATLIAMVECPEDYTHDALIAAKEEVMLRKPDKETARQLATEIMREKAKELWNKFSLINGPPATPESLFLNQDEVLKILREEYELWADKKEDMQIDLWSYVIGGGI